MRLKAHTPMLGQGCSQRTHKKVHFLKFEFNSAKFQFPNAKKLLFQKGKCFISKLFKVSFKIEKLFEVIDFLPDFKYFKIQIFQIMQIFTLFSKTMRLLVILRAYSTYESFA